MKNMKKTSGIIVGLLVISILTAGCAGKTRKMAGDSIQPEWVQKGSHVVRDKKGGAFYGVGSVWGIRNPSLMRTTSENRARAEIAKMFKTYTASLMKDYQMSAMAGNTDVTTEEVNVEQTIKTFAKAKLSGVMIRDHWKDPETGEFFALACMDINEFRKFLQTARELSDTLRNRVMEHAENAFEELEAEELRHE